MIRVAVAIVATLASVIVAMFWAFSYEDAFVPQGLRPRASMVWNIDPQTALYASSVDGWIRVGAVRANPPYEVPPGDDVQSWMWLGATRQPRPDPHWKYLVDRYVFGLVITCNHAMGVVSIRGIAVPHAFVCSFLLACAVLSGAHAPVRRWWRWRQGRCIHCGYNLAGNVSGVCPECGRACDAPSSVSLVGPPQP